MTIHAAYEMTKPAANYLTFRLKQEIDADTMKMMLDEFFSSPKTCGTPSCCSLSRRRNCPALLQSAWN